MNAPRPAGPGTVTIDSSLLYPTTARRFLMSLWEMEGLQIELVPRTTLELYRLLIDSERSHWRNALEKQAERTGRTWTNLELQRIPESTAQAAGEWFNHEVGYGGQPPPNRPMLTTVELSAGQHVIAARIGETIPRSCFIGPGRDRNWGDRQIIGESVAGNFQILATDNRGMIRRNRLNAWLRETGHCTRDLVLRADDAIEQAGGWRSQPEKILEATLRAALPTKPGTAEREHDIVTKFIKRLNRQGLEQIAATCSEEWLGPGRGAIYIRARAHIAQGPGLARATEQRRLTATRAAARNAGWDHR